MKADRGQIERAFSDPAGFRFFLFHGPDEAGSHSYVKRLTAALGEEAERVELSGGGLKSDPARLADEAASISLFGGSRFIVVEPAGEEIVPAVEALLEATGAANPVAIVAGTLKPSSRLLKLALGEPRALVFASYVPSGRDAERLAVELGREAGLSVRPEVARRLAEANGGNRAVMEQELAKLALYLDAAPDQVRALEHDALDEVGAEAGDGDLSRLVESVGGGKGEMVQEELARLAGEGIEGVPLIRAMLRRMLLLARLRAEVDQGRSVGDVMASHGKSLFWKEKDAISGQVGKWRSGLIAKSVDRLVEAERQLKASGGIGPIAADEELLAICRQAGRLF